VQKHHPATTEVATANPTLTPTALALRAAARIHAVLGA
jgi:hypothetical protein